MKKLITISICCILSTSFVAKGQESSKKFEYINFISSYNYGRTQEFDFGLSLTKNYRASIFDDIFYYGPYFKMGYNWGDNNLLTTKIGYEYSGFLMLFIGRISMNSYTDFKENQICIKPEIALTAMGVINLTYGYNFALNRNDKFNLTGHYIGIDIHIQIKELK